MERKKFPAQTARARNDSRRWELRGDAVREIAILELAETSVGVYFGALKARRIPIADFG